MDHNNLSMLENNEALDFTSAPKKVSRELIVESPVLDLSCKKQNSSSCSLSPVSIEAISNPPSIENACEENVHEHTRHYGDTEIKSPFEGRNFMVTPPSEVDSPRKQRCEQIYNHANVATSLTSNDTMNQHYEMLRTSHSISCVQPAILSMLPVTQNGSCDTAATRQLPVSTTSTTSTLSHETSSELSVSPETSKKAPRPFKAYPKDPLTMSVGSAELMYDQNSNEAYSEFRKRMLESVKRTNDGTNIKMRRVTKSPGLPTSTMDDKDTAYWERRRKNNEAAKRSRDARRAKEDEIAIRAAFLEQENMKLKYELVALRNETAKLRCMVYTS